MSAVPQQSHACLLLRFEGVAGLVLLPDEPALLDGISQLAPSWKYTSTVTESHGGLPPCITKVGKNQNNPSTFDIESVYLDEPLLGLPTASALCALMADVLEAHIEESQNPIALHAGAVAMGNRLIAITGPKRAGKSTLIARLCAEPDLQIFCDDVLPISPQGEGVALGVAPRLRLPLPPRRACISSSLPGNTWGHTTAATVTCVPATWHCTACACRLAQSWYWTGKPTPRHAFTP